MRFFDSHTSPVRIHGAQLGRAATLVLALVAVIGALAIWLSLPRAEPGQPRAAQSTSWATLLAASDRGFEQNNTAWDFRFPDDHATHAGFPSETWYFTGALTSGEGRRFGFQLMLSRLGLLPPEAHAARKSAWSARDVYRAHFVLADIASGETHVDERISRAALGLSGSAQSPDRVWIENWRVQLTAGSGDGAPEMRLDAAHGPARLEVALRALKPPVPATRGAGAFHSYFVPRLDADGSLSLSGSSSAVRGSAWLDRSWGVLPLPVGAVVWDRFALQLSNGEELSLLRLRRRDGSGQPYTLGTWVKSDGNTRQLERGEARIAVLDEWQSANDAVHYPSHWRVEVDAADVAIEVTPLIADQELDLSLRYWAGIVELAGDAAGRQVSGTGFVELFGYADQGS